MEFPRLHNKVRSWSRVRVSYIILVFAIIGHIFSLPVFVVAANPDGAYIFNQKCAGCHTIGRGNLVGPDLKQAITWSVSDLTVAIKRMEKMAGPLEAKETDAIIQYLKSPSITAASNNQQKNNILIAQPAKTLPTLSKQPGSAEIGRKLFLGEQSLTNGGMSCLACHTVGGDGGTLGPNLSNIASRMNEATLVIACEQAPFKVMKAAYAKQPITREEALHLAKYFQSLSTNPEKQHQTAVGILAAAGAGTLLLVIAFGYRKRSKSARSKLQRR